MSPTLSNTVPTTQAIPTEEPQRLQADPQNLALAKASVPVQQNPDPAPQSEIDRIRNTLAAENPGAESSVKQLPPEWVHYDNYFRPVIVNPFREPLQIVYHYAGAPRVLVIPALASIVTEVAQLGAYCFTAMVLNRSSTPTNVAVGCLFGGGVSPGPGQPPATRPPPPETYENVPVAVTYSNATYKPFVAKQIIDVGDDPSVGERKVLLDGATPAWGQWTQTPTGERQFEVHKTQQFPGIDAPAEGPLPGDYQLASASEPTSGLGTILLILVGAVVAALSLGAIVVRIFRANRHRGAPWVKAHVTVTPRPGPGATFETRPGDEPERDHLITVVPVEVGRSTTIEENPS